MSAKQRRAVVYCRISRDRVGAGVGVGRQEDDCRRLAEQLGCTVTRVFTDNDTSAYKGKRRGYLALLQALRDGQGDVLIAWHNDRLHRSPRELEDFIDLIEQTRTEVHFVRSGQLDLSTPSGRFFARQLGTMARYESEHRGERQSASQKQRAERGQWIGGGRPFGWERDGITERPEEAQAIRDATAMILHGGTVLAVVRMLNERGLKTTRLERPWGPTTARRILMRARNAGLVEYQGDIVADAVWKPLVTRDEWTAVCELLKDPRRRVSPGNRPRWLGSGIYRCACGEPLVAGRIGDASVPAYRCPVARQTVQGQAPAVKRRHVARAAARLDAWVEEVLLARLRTGDLIPAYTTLPDEAVDVAQVRRRIAALEHNRDLLGRRLAEGEISLKLMDEFNRSAEEQIAALERELASAMVSTPAAELVVAEDVDEAWAALDLERRREVVRELVVVTVYPQGSRGGRFDPSAIKIEWNV